MALSDSQTGRRPFWQRSGPRPPANPEPPSLTQTTFSACRAQYPGGPDQVLVGWRVARSHAGFFPVRAAFPVIAAGRRPPRYFRGLLKLHTRYGLQNCSPTLPRLYPQAPPRPVTPLRPGRLHGSDARKLSSSTNNLLEWVLPPLVICAVEAHPVSHISFSTPCRGSRCPVHEEALRQLDRLKF